MIPRILAVAAAGLLCGACAAAAPPAGGGVLQPCPRSRNCVSSLEREPQWRVDPLPLRGSAAEGLAALRRVILALPRSRVVAEGAGYLRAEFRSLIFRFVDDVDCVVDEPAGVIHIRSASRVGQSDLGVNRRRVAELRERLALEQTPGPDANR